MRLLAVITLAVSGFLSVAGAPPQRGDSPSGGAESVREQVNSDFSALLEAFDQQSNNLQRIRIDADSFAYRSGSAREILERTRQAAVEHLDQPELEPMRDLVDFELRDSQRRLRRDPRCQSCVSDDSYREATRHVSRILRLLGTLDSLVVDLHVVSTPSSSRVTLWVRNSDEPERETTTEDTLKNVYRGRYLARVEKSGWKRAELPINLLRETGTLGCSLVESSSSEPSTCRLN